MSMSSDDLKAFGRLENQVGTLVNTAERVEEKVDKLDEKVDLKVGGIDRRVDKLEQKDAAMDEWRKSVDGRLERLMDTTYFKKAAAVAIPGGALAGVASAVWHVIQMLTGG